MSKKLKLIGPKKPVKNKTGQKIGPINDPESVIGQMADIGHKAMQLFGINPFGPEDPSAYSTLENIKGQTPRFDTAQIQEGKFIPKPSLAASEVLTDFLHRALRTKGMETFSSGKETAKFLKAVPIEMELEIRRYLETLRQIASGAINRNTIEEGALAGRQLKELFKVAKPSPLPLYRRSSLIEVPEHEIGARFSNELLHFSSSPTAIKLKENMISLPAGTKSIPISAVSFPFSSELEYLTQGDFIIEAIKKLGQRKLIKARKLEPGE